MIFNQKDIVHSYYTWLYDTMCGGRDMIFSYHELFHALHECPYIPYIDMDENRALDGCNLRYSFAIDYCKYKTESDSYISIMNSCQHSIEDIMILLDKPCSMLEMLVALSIKIEEDMSDPEYGNRTQEWFWSMIGTLGLNDMQDGKFDRERFNKITNDFINHNYQPNGKGGLFYIPNSKYDLRNLDIWRQMSLYLSKIT